VAVTRRSEIEQDPMLSDAERRALLDEWAAIAARSLRPAAAVSTARAQAAQSFPATPLALAVLVLGALTYAAVGTPTPDALARRAATLPAASLIGQPEPVRSDATHPGGDDSMADRIARLEARLRAQPGDLEQWVLLARSKGSQRDFAGAAAALERALALAPGHPELQADLADALAMTAGRSMAGRPTELVRQALATEPTHRKALALAATAAMQRGDAPQAIAHWRRLKATLPPEAPDHVRLDETIARLAAGELPARPPAGAQLDGAVTLSPAIAARLREQPLPASATLWVVARASAGPPMPLAVQRLPAPTGAGPNTFSLTDAAAMNPAMPLSSATRVDIEARISLSGQATRQPGDLLGRASGVAPGASGVRIVIDEVVR
jgi:cytochrome c-type biogenesis protein CcmH